MRNKKRQSADPTPDQTALERHVEDMMNPRPDQAPVPATAPAPRLDIFKGMPAEKIPLGAPRTAPVMPAKVVTPINLDSKPAKSLFSSVEALQRSDASSTPVTVAIKPKLTAPLGAPLTAPLVTAAGAPKPSSLGSNPTAPTGTTDSALTVDRLARREEFSDAATESAVADIMAKDGDDLLAAEDTVRTQQSAPVFKKPSRGDKIRAIITSKWLLLLIPLFIIALAAIPYSRYKLAGLVVKKTLAVTVIDSKTTKPVSGATVNYNGRTTKTNAAGLAQLPVPLGSGTLAISKGYYQTYSHKGTIGFGAGDSQLSVNLVATGRQVPLTIVNKLTKQPLAGVTVKVLGTSAVSDKAGKLIIVLPTRTATATATVSANGYNTTTAEVEITDNAVAANNLAIVPAGAVYFLSTLSGETDVVKTNLDGSGRHTVLAGTGHEDADTSLTASRDWRYVVLKSHREVSQTGLYLIDTTTDKVTQFDTSAATYTPIGWSGHNFVYDVVRTAQAQSQAGRESLKSYNADQQQLNQLDQTQAAGDATSYAYQGYNNFFLIDTQLVYNTRWYSGGTGAPRDLTSQNDAIRTVSATGAGKKDLQTYAANGVTSVLAVRVLPTTIDYAVASSTDATTSYYVYSNGGVVTDSSLSAATFSKTYPVYLTSPDGTKTFWNDLVGGRQALQVGDKNAGSPTTVASTGEYTAYGWYGSQYLLLSRAGSGLYIMPASGINNNATPFKVSNYYQSATTPGGYGGGF